VSDPANVALVFLFSQGLQVVLVSTMVFVFLFFFGVLVAAITDESYRTEFIGEILEEMRRSLAVRSVYLAALKRGVAPSAG
jgi:hypothetical protein